MSLKYGSSHGARLFAACLVVTLSLSFSLARSLSPALSSGGIGIEGYGSGVEGLGYMVQFARLPSLLFFFITLEPRVE